MFLPPTLIAKVIASIRLNTGSVHTTLEFIGRLLGDLERIVLRMFALYHLFHWMLW